MGGGTLVSPTAVPRAGSRLGATWSGLGTPRGDSPAAGRASSRLTATVLSVGFVAMLTGQSKAAVI